MLRFLGLYSNQYNAWSALDPQVLLGYFERNNCVLLRKFATPYLLFLAQTRKSYRNCKIAELRHTYANAFQCNSGRGINPYTGFPISAIPPSGVRGGG